MAKPRAARTTPVMSAWPCSDEKVEVSGSLGKVDVQNRMLEALEGDLSELRESGAADAFCLYLYGLVLADRCAAPPAW